VSGLQWTIDAYTLVLDGFLVLAGSTADRLGRRRVFQVGLAAFGLGSLLCGLAPGIGWLIAARVLQAVGGTMLNPVAMAIVATTFPDPRERARAIGSPVGLGMLAVAGLSTLCLLGYESRRVDPLLELRLFRSVPFSAAIVMALCALCGFGAFLFVTTQYLQDVRGMSAFAAGLCLLPVGLLTVVLSPRTGRVVGGRGPRLPLVVAGAALALGGAASTGIGPVTPLVAVLAVYLLFGIFLGTVNPPITNTAVSGMPRSMAGLATSLASAGRQTGTSLGVAISGTVTGSAAVRGGTAFTGAAHGVWWMLVGLGAGIVLIGLGSTGRWAAGTARRAATLFDPLESGTRA
jgi:predicted MFS family arabinose efflux permease